MCLSIRFLIFALILTAATQATRSRVLAQNSELELSVIDGSTGEMMPAVVQITRSNGRAFVPKKFVRIGDSFVIGGKAIMKVPRGNYTFMISRGPQYRTAFGRFEIERGATDNKSVELKQVRDISVEGWHAGDMAIFADPDDAALIMNATDLKFMNFVTWSESKYHWKNRELPGEPTQALESERAFNAIAGVDWRDGGGLLFANNSAPFDLSAILDSEDSEDREAANEFASPFDTRMKLDSEDRLLCAAMDAAANDLPLWIANDSIDAVAVLSPAISDSGVDAIDGMRERPKDLPKNEYVISWQEEVYFHLLNAGFRIPPTACSAAGRLANLPGCNRAFVHCDADFSYDSWIENQKLGRVFITNGPLLRVKANGELPGHVFKASGNDELEIEVVASLSLQRRAEHLEIIRDGAVLHKIELNDLARKGGQLPRLKFTESGWFTVRVVSGDPNTVRCASTGPFHVEFDGQPIVRKESVQFFKDWVYERGKQLKREGTAASMRTLSHYRDTLEFWNERLEKAR